MSEAARKLLAALDKVREGETRTPKATIGASGVGNICDAYLALSLRAFDQKPILPTLSRIFETGHKLEDMVASDLLKALPLAFPGATMSTTDAKGYQHGQRLYGGFLRARADGIAHVDGKPVLIEIKTMNKSRFNACDRKGVQTSDPKYYSQVQMMLGMWEMTTCYFIALCKDDSRYLVQEVSFDWMQYESLKGRVEVALGNEARRISDDPDSYNCSSCDFRDQCWAVEQPRKACSTCRRAEPQKNGRFYCQVLDREAPGEPCESWAPYLPKGKFE